jgi:ArsR family transcriptional regulator, arsenate/arsenite/antimonite-responsive transcriptional repressor
MAQAKNSLFNQQTRETAALYKALAHPARIEILAFLSSQTSCYCGNISDEIPLSRTTVNQHLAELKQAGLIHATQKGNKVFYCVCSNGIEKLKQANIFLFTEIFTSENITCEL